MTREEFRDQVVGLQNTAKQIKEQVGMLRSDINKLEGCIKQDDEAIEAKFDEEVNKAYQRGYENGFAEGRTRKELSEKQDKVIRIGDEVVVNGITGVVMRLDEKGNVDRYFTSDGKTFGNISGFQNNEVIKTGRHFDEVEKLLEVMKG